jgi:hypothetical protein
LARIADFAAKDLRRKRKMMQVNGGQWRPPADMKVPEMPTVDPRNMEKGVPTPPSEPRAPPQMPSFAGMMPTTGHATLPRGFTVTRDDTPPRIDSEDIDLEIATVQAEEEWINIREAFLTLESKFGPDFQPLQPDYTPQIMSPFGPALQYRTYQIAGVWLALYMGLIVCMRAHPSMPPAMAVAAGIAAPQTAFFANQIGRIVAGVAPVNATEVTPGTGGLIIETCVPVFTAAVQYQDSAQRNWIIEQLLDVTRLTGWQTASAIATGCERSWSRAAEIGRGPPYKRSLPERPPRPSAVLPNSSNPNRTLIIANKTSRVHWAMGLLAVQEDLDELSINDDER